MKIPGKIVAFLKLIVKYPKWYLIDFEKGGKKTGE
jgi:hypothetical protein